MIHEYAIAAQFIAFMIGYIVHTIFARIRENNFLNCLSEQTLMNIQNDIRNHNRKEYDEQGD